jgi:hypothetical protein
MQRLLTPYRALMRVDQPPVVRVSVEPERRPTEGRWPMTVPAVARVVDGDPDAVTVRDEFAGAARLRTVPQDHPVAAVGAALLGRPMAGERR